MANVMGKIARRIQNVERAGAFHRWSGNVSERQRMESVMTKIALRIKNVEVTSPPLIFKRTPTPNPQNPRPPIQITNLQTPTP